MTYMTSHVQQLQAVMSNKSTFVVGFDLFTSKTDDSLIYQGVETLECVNLTLQGLRNSDIPFTQGHVELENVLDALYSVLGNDVSKASTDGILPFINLDNDRRFKVGRVRKVNETRLRGNS